MTKEEYAINLLRMIAATSGASLLYQISRELFGKSYYDLGEEQKGMVHNQQQIMIFAGCRGINPDLFENLDRREKGPPNVSSQPPPASYSGDNKGN